MWVPAFYDYSTASEGTIPWTDLAIYGEYETIPAHTYVEVGDQITGCSGNITIIYVPTATSLGFWTFT